MDLISIWSERKNKYPWVLTIAFIITLISSLIFGMTINSQDPILAGFIFIFNDIFSLIIWLPVSFAIGFVKNRNLDYYPESKGGTIARGFIYGISLFMCMILAYWIPAIIFPNSGLTQIFGDIQYINYMYAWLSVLSCILGIFISITIRGSLYPKFLEYDE